MVLQAGAVQFVALNALFSFAYVMSIFVVVACAGLIGYIVARHAIHAFTGELEDVTLSVAWGIVIAEISWLAYYWTLAYTSLKITQVALVATLLGYMVIVVYGYLYRREQGATAKADITMPVVFSLTGIALILIFFNVFDPTSL